MPDSYVANRLHCVFSTKNRTAVIPPEMQPRLWSFMAGIARENGITPITIGGFDDHAHVFIGVPPTIPLAKAMQLIKAGSSKWCNQNFANGQFEWQGRLFCRKRESFTCRAHKNVYSQSTPTSSKARLQRGMAIVLAS